ncbi:hypothetical protein RP20_CCG005380 [Aedes albopictus]|nr:hypothetical protein RP20_CCG005380 [Aedes albopictus]
MAENEFLGFDETTEGASGGNTVVGTKQKVANLTSAVSDPETAAKLISFVRERDQVMNKVLRIYEDVNVLAPIDPSHLKVYAAKLHSAYDEYSKYHSKIIAIIPDDEVNAQENECIRFENNFQHTSAAVEARILRTPVIQMAPPAQVVVHQQPLKAPIPTFDGEYTKWPKLKAMFQDVMAQSRDSDAIKLYHLDKALVGAAAGVLDVKTINDGNYAQAWTLLAERYENKRVIVETHIRGLLSLKKMTSESHRELRSLLDECINHVESLAYLKQQVSEVSELMVVCLLTGALGKSTRKQWEQTLKPGELPQYKSTVAFLKAQCQVLERCEAAYSQTTTKQIPKQQGTELKTQYLDFMREYQQLGHCREVDMANDNPNLKPYYLPHHAVLRPGSSSTKCRVVFDASAKSAPTNPSLNEALLVGPVVQSDILSIMIRFRQHRYVFTADIKKMYRQIVVQP